MGLMVLHHQQGLMVLEQELVVEQDLVKVHFLLSLPCLKIMESMLTHCLYMFIHISHNIYVLWMQIFFNELVIDPGGYNFFRRILVGLIINSVMKFKHEVISKVLDSPVCVLGLGSETASVIDLNTRAHMNIPLYKFDTVPLLLGPVALEQEGCHQLGSRSFSVASMSSSDTHLTRSADIFKGIQSSKCSFSKSKIGIGNVQNVKTFCKAVQLIPGGGLRSIGPTVQKFENFLSKATLSIHIFANFQNLCTLMLIQRPDLTPWHAKLDPPETQIPLMVNCEPSQLSGASIRGLLALAALGLISEDATLTGAALAELLPHENNKDYLHHIAFLKAAQAAIKGNFQESRLILSRTLHLHPESASLWRSLSRQLLTSGTSIKSLNASSQAAAAATKLSQAAGENKYLAQDAITGVMSKLEGYQNPKRSGSLLAAQRAVLLCPGSPEAWATLIAAKARDKRSQTESQKYIKQLAGVWSQQSSQQLSKWLQKISVA
ncbi:unnamed protein product, partial [Meganyctiphanes norvegica]